jgi:hypothetical protein
MLAQRSRIDQSAILVNGTVIGGLQSPPSGWFEAIVQGAVYLAATQTQSSSLAAQQLAVSHAAHDALLWTFHGTRLYATVNSKLKAVLDPIGLNASSPEAVRATQIGREAARRVVVVRADDGINEFVDYTQQPAAPGVYQATPGGGTVPDTPQAQFIRLFGGVGDVTRFRAPPPPDVRSDEYEPYLEFVRTQGERNSSVRQQYDTETAYLWRESSPMYVYNYCTRRGADADILDVVDGTASRIASLETYTRLMFWLRQSSMRSSIMR